MWVKIKNKMAFYKGTKTLDLEKFRFKHKNDTFSA